MPAEGRNTCADLRSGENHVPVLAVGEGEHPSRQEVELHVLCAVACRRMYDVVGKHRGQFGFRLDLYKQPRLIAILPPGSAHAFGVESFTTRNR